MTTVFLLGDRFAQWLLIGMAAASLAGCSEDPGDPARSTYIHVVEVHSSNVESHVTLTTQEQWTVMTSGVDACEWFYYEAGSFSTGLAASFDSELQQLIPLTTALNIEDAVGALREAERGSLGIGLMDDEVLEGLGLAYGEHWRLLPPDSGLDNLLVEAIRELIDKAYSQAMASTDDPDCLP
jgi:hypothetical protein